MPENKLHCHGCGTGKPIVWVHGFPLDHTMWQYQYEELTEFRSLAVDLRGFGRSDMPVDQLSLGQMAEDVNDLLEVTIPEQPFVYVGLSMGGYIAWQFLQQPARQRLSALILCDTRAAADSEEMRRARRLTARRVLEEGPTVIADPMLEKLFAPSTVERREDRVRATREVMMATGSPAIAAALQAMADRPDATDLLAQIDVPTLLICGREDQITAASEMATMAERIPGACLEVIPDAGHMSPLEQPESVNRIIRQFLTETANW
ncbi:MAG: alpha/beta fold hydrolase [Pirellulaceae bacterium]